MALDLLHGKLEKMEFRFYEKPDMVKANKKVPKTIKVMYNPNKFSLSYNTKYDSGQDTSIAPTEPKPLYNCPRTLTLTLQFDGTGASPSSILGGVSTIIDTIKGRYINDQINEFMDQINPDTHANWNMAVVWGKIFFPCVVTSASVNYTLFRHDGIPLRGDLALTLYEQTKNFTADIKKKLLSPDLTKSYLVQQGDRLDALCKEFYDDSSLYHEVARVNNIPNPRKLVVGQSLTFPPIDKIN